MNRSTCPTCQAPVSESDGFCGECGKVLSAPASTQACPACGTAVDPDDAFCSECGDRLPDREAVPEQTGKTGLLPDTPPPLPVEAMEARKDPPRVEKVTGGSGKWWRLPVLLLGLAAVTVLAWWGFSRIEKKLLFAKHIPEPPAAPIPATPKPATPKPATPKPATPKPATPKPATPKAPAITFGAVTLQHNRDLPPGGKGMEIEFPLTIVGYQGRDLVVVAHFTQYGGKFLKDFDGKYRTRSGNVITHAEIRPKWQSTEWKRIVLKMPYDQLHMVSGRHDLSFYLAVQETGGKSLGRSDSVNFVLTKP